MLKVLIRFNLYIQVAPFESVGLAVFKKRFLVPRHARVVSEPETGQVWKPLQDLNISKNTRAAEVEFGQVWKPLQDGNVASDTRAAEVDFG